MLVSRMVRSAVVRDSIRLFKRTLSSYTSTEPAAFEKKTEDVGPTTKSFKQPFLKNVFLGKYDEDFLTYPEVVDLDELQKRIVENVTIEPSRGEAVAKQSARERVSSLFRSNVPLIADSETNESERLKIYELLNLDLQTSLLMEVQTLVISIISKYGTTDQKNKYLSKLFSGEITGAFAMSEACTGSDPSSLGTQAEFNRKTKTYRITGTKEWVSNGKYADLYVVIAKNEEVRGRSENEVTAFLVEAKTPGISLTDQNPTQLDECGLCKVHFENVLVHEPNILGNRGEGFNIASDVIVHNRFFVMSSLLNLLKNTFKEVRENLLTRRQVPVSLKDCELVQYKLSQICTSIYAMESVLYLYTGMIDSYDIDVRTESACVQYFCYQTTLEGLNTCNELLGGKSYDGNYNYMKNLAEVQGLILASKTCTLLQLFVAFTSMAYAAVSMAETIKRNRNPLDYPGFILKKMWSNSNNKSDSPSMTLKLYMNLHPSLKPSAEILEYSVLRIQWGVENFLSRYGKDSAYKQMDLCRLANISKEIFAMTAVIGRASRAYCTGIRYSDQEIMLAHSFCREALHRVRVEMDKLIDGGIVSNDVGHLKIGAEVLNLGGYFVEHPLVRNIK